MSQLEVDKIVPQSGTTLTIGDSGDTIAIASGATLSGSLNADNLDSGTVPDARITGAYTGITNLTIQDLAISDTSPIITMTDTDTNALFRMSASSALGSVKLEVDDNAVGSNPSLAIEIQNSEAMRIDSSGNVGIGTSSPSQKLDVVGSIEVSDGIYIGGTGTANKLDDYEEGTWSPTLINYDGTPTVNYATYTKIGRLVTIATHIDLDGTSDSDNFRISSLPFNIATSGSYYGGFVTYTNSTITDNIYVFANASGSIYLYKSSGVVITYNNLGASANIRLVATYTT